MSQDLRSSEVASSELEPAEEPDIRSRRGSSATPDNTTPMLIDTFALHPDIARLLQERMKAIVPSANVYFREVRETAQTAHEYFGEEQFRLTVKELMESVATHTISLSETRELIENLIALIDLLLGEGEHHAAKLVSDKVRLLIRDIMPLLEVLESVSNSGITNWTAVNEAIALPPTKAQVNHLDLKWIDIKNRVLLGFGGMGAIYKVTFGGQIIAMKMNRCPSTGADIFPRSALAGTFVRHPLIIRQIASFPTTNCQLTLSEYIEGNDLHTVKHKINLSEEVVKLLSAQICLALQHLHKMGFMHRDIKPGNVLVMKRCRVKLIDFDFAKICLGKFIPRRHVATYINRAYCEFYDKQQTGTKKYASVEIENKEAYGRAADWYSVGKTIDEIYTNCFPYCKSVPRETRVPVGDIKHLIDNLMHVDASLRLSSIYDIKKHPFFIGVDWNLLETGQVNCSALDEVIEVRHLESNMYEMREKLRSLDPEKMYDKKMNTSVFKVFSNGFHKVLEKLENNEPLTRTDLFPPIEYRQDVHNMPSLLENPSGLKKRLTARLENAPVSNSWAELND